MGNLLDAKDAAGWNALLFATRNGFAEIALLLDMVPFFSSLAMESMASAPCVVCDHI